MPPPGRSTPGRSSTPPTRPTPPGCGRSPRTWRPGEIAAQAAACNGCGECRTQAPARRMCPTFRATRGEEATPRAKANLLQTLLAPGGDARGLSADDVRDVAELCVNCKMCATE